MFVPVLDFSDFSHVALVVYVHHRLTADCFANKAARPDAVLRHSQVNDLRAHRVALAG